VSVTGLRRALPYVLLLVLFALLAFSVQMKSPTMDEQNHIARGLAYLVTGDLRLSQEHPPGINVWQTWPLLLDPGIHLPVDSPSWANAEWYGFADQLLWRANDHPDTMVYATRVPVMWLTLILAALLYRWTREIGGPWAGLIALALLVFDANILAHGRLTTTDLGVTCLSFAAVYALWHAVGATTWTSWAVAGVLLGAAQISKFSALVLVPVTLLIVVLEWIMQARRTSVPASQPGRWIARLAVLYGTALLIIWAAYRLTWAPLPFLSGAPGPAPAYWAGITTILQRTGGGTPTFLIGKHSTEGWWYYFPVAFVIKTPLPNLIFLVIAFVLWATRPLRAGRRRSAVDIQLSSGLPEDPTAKAPNRSTNSERNEGPALRMRSFPNPLPYLWSPVLGFWVIALLGSFDIGYRHILPTLPFLYAFIGWQLGMWTWEQTGKVVGPLSPLLPPAQEVVHRRSSAPSLEIGRGLGIVARLSSIVVVALLLWLAITTLSLFPHYLAYFNALAGGPQGGYRFLVDSNLDWGQDLPGLVEYAKQRGIDRVYLSWFGAAHPEAYGISFHPLPGYWRFRGEPPAYGLNPYAPSPGTYAISASNLQGLMFTDHDIYDWFRQREPTANIGHSIRIYQVDGQADHDKVIVLGVPLSQLAEEERDLLVEASSVRRYDPATGLIVPFAFSDALYVAPEPPESGRVLRQGPGYVVSTGPAGQLPASVPNARFGEHIIPLQAQVGEVSLAEDNVLDVSVHWGVESAPHRAAISFAHLLDAEGKYVAGWDGTTAPATSWQAGDQIRQDYRIPLPAGLAPGTYQVEVGWYDTGTGERWPYVVEGETVGDRILLPEVRIPA
jgi:hypothetical protein